MYGYNRAIFSGIGQANYAEIAKAWRADRPTSEFKYMFQNKETGQIVYGNELGRQQGLARPDMLQYIGIAPGFEPKWYTDPIVLGGAAAVAGIIIIGLVLRKKK